MDNWYNGDTETKCLGTDWLYIKLLTHCKSIRLLKEHVDYFKQFGEIST